MTARWIPGEYDGDAYFPEWCPDEWVLVDSEGDEAFALEGWSRQPA